MSSSEAQSVAAPEGQPLPTTQQRGLAFYLGLRHLKQRRSRLLSGAALAGLGSVGLGVMAMCLAMALMTGYTETLLEKMLVGGAVIVIPIGTPADIEELPAKVAAHEGVTFVARSLLVQGSLQPASPRGSAGSVDVHLRGVESGVEGPLGSGEPGSELQQVDGLPAVRLGVELAGRLGVDVGDRVRLVALDLQRGARFRYRTLHVAGLFETGFALFDSEYAVMQLQEVQRLSGGIPFYEVGSASPGDLDGLRSRLVDSLGDDYLVRDWRQSSPGLFTALRLQKWALFLLLGLIVVVSTFNVAAALLVLIRERTREVGVLLALGVTPGALRQSFLISGIAIGVFGCLLGGAAAALLSWLVSTFELLQFAPGVREIYFIDSIPLKLKPRDLFAVVSFTLVVTALGCWWPLRGVQRISPAAALRAE